MGDRVSSPPAWALHRPRLGTCPGVSGLAPFRWRGHPIASPVTLPPPATMTPHDLGLLVVLLLPGMLLSVLLLTTFAAGG
jgi:hypothetical protein